MTTHPSKQRPIVGILALQGNVDQHCAILRSLEADHVLIKRAHQLTDQLHALIIPGGESTTMCRFLASDPALSDAIRHFVTVLKRPVLGTCAGLVLLAKWVEREKLSKIGREQEPLKTLG